MSAPPNDFLRDTTRRLSALVFDGVNQKVKVLDQLLLPHEKVYLDITGVQSAAEVIKKMQVRGAPLIATVALFGLYMESLSVKIAHENLKDMCKMLSETRPTAINLNNELNALVTSLAGVKEDEVPTELRRYVIDQYSREEEENRALCWNGAQLVKTFKRDPNGGLYLMTICNTGSLATCSWGTALGIIAGLYELGEIAQVFILETRPYNQGSRLTATELTHLGVPFTLITDSMAAMAMHKYEVDAVIVGADQVTVNGDTANKIGTYNLAITANYFDIPFVVALPSQTINMNAPNGGAITIEERKPDEFKYFNNQLICPESTEVWNPAFDITPAKLIQCYVTEVGVFNRNSSEPFSIENLRPKE